MKNADLAKLIVRVFALLLVANALINVIGNVASDYAAMTAYMPMAVYVLGASLAWIFADRFIPQREREPGEPDNVRHFGAVLVGTAGTIILLRFAGEFFAGFIPHDYQIGLIPAERVAIVVRLLIAVSGGLLAYNARTVSAWMAR